VRQAAAMRRLSGLLLLHALSPAEERIVG